MIKEGTGDWESESSAGKAASPADVKDRGSALSWQQLILLLPFPSLTHPLLYVQSGRGVRGSDVGSLGNRGEGERGRGDERVTPPIPCPAASG